MKAWIQAIAWKLTSLFGWHRLKKCRKNNTFKATQSYFFKIEVSFVFRASSLKKSKFENLAKIGQIVWMYKAIF